MKNVINIEHAYIQSTKAKFIIWFYNMVNMGKKLKINSSELNQKYTATDFRSQKQHQNQLIKCKILSSIYENRLHPS